MPTVPNLKPPENAWIGSTPPPPSADEPKIPAYGEGLKGYLESLQGDEVPQGPWNRDISEGEARTPVVRPDTLSSPRLVQPISAKGSKQRDYDAELAGAVGDTPNPQAQDNSPFAQTLLSWRQQQKQKAETRGLTREWLDGTQSFVKKIEAALANAQDALEDPQAILEADALKAQAEQAAKNYENAKAWNDAAQQYEANRIAQPYLGGSEGQADLSADDPITRAIGTAVGGAAVQGLAGMAGNVAFIAEQLGATEAKREKAIRDQYEIPEDASPLRLSDALKKGAEATRLYVGEPLNEYGKTFVVPQEIEQQFPLLFGTARAVGGTLPYLFLAEMAAIPLGTAGGAFVGAAFMGAQKYEETYKAAIAAGYDEEKAQNAAVIAGIGTTGLMTLPMSQWLGGLPEKFKSTMLREILGLQVHGLTFATVMEAQKALDNVVAHFTYDPNRKFTEGVAFIDPKGTAQAAENYAAGVLLGLPGHIIQKMREPEKTEGAKPPPIPTPEEQNAQHIQDELQMQRDHVADMATRGVPDDQLARARARVDELKAQTPKPTKEEKAGEVAIGSDRYRVTRDSVEKIGEPTAQEMEKRFAPGSLPDRIQQLRAEESAREAQPGTFSKVDGELGELYNSLKDNDPLKKEINTLADDDVREIARIAETRQISTEEALREWAAEGGHRHQQILDQAKAAGGAAAESKTGAEARPVEGASRVGNAAELGASTEGAQRASAEAAQPQPAGTPAAGAVAGQRAPGLPGVAPAEGRAAEVPAAERGVRAAGRAADEHGRGGEPGTAERAPSAEELRRSSERVDDLARNFRALLARGEIDRDQWGSEIQRLGASLDEIEPIIRRGLAQGWLRRDADGNIRKSWTLDQLRDLTLTPEEEAFYAALRGGAGEKLRLTPSDPRMKGTSQHVMDIVRGDEPVGYIKYKILDGEKSKDTAYVDYISLNDPDVDRFSRRDIRELREAFRKLHPTVNKWWGKRISGAKEINDASDKIQSIYMAALRGGERTEGAKVAREPARFIPTVKPRFLDPGQQALEIMRGDKPIGYMKYTLPGPDQPRDTLMVDFIKISDPEANSIEDPVRRHRERLRTVRDLRESFRKLHPEINKFAGYAMSGMHEKFTPGEENFRVVMMKALRGGGRSAGMLMEDFLRGINEEPRYVSDIPGITQYMSDALNAGKPVDILRDVQANTHLALGEHAHMLPPGGETTVLSRIEPVGNGRVKVIFTNADKSTAFEAEMPWSRLLNLRALTVGNGVHFVGFSDRDLGGGTTGLIARNYGAEVGHEVSHILYPTHDDATRSRLVDHANSLRILDQNMADYSRAIGDEEGAKRASNRTVADEYRDHYTATVRELQAARKAAGLPPIPRKEVDEYLKGALDQESVAHMAEWWMRGLLTDKQVAPVLDLLQKLKSGELGAAAASRGEAVSNRTFSDPALFTNVDPSKVPVYPEKKSIPVGTIMGGKFSVERTSPHLAEVETYEDSIPAVTYRVKSGDKKIATAEVIAGGDGIGHVSLVEVDRAYRRQGIATALYDLIESKLAAEGRTLTPLSGELTRQGAAFWQARRNRAKEPYYAAGSPEIVGAEQKRELDKLGFYSQALEAAKGLKQAKGTPEQFRAMLKSAGVKDAEIAATGLDRFFAERSEGKKNTITKSEILDHLQKNRVEVREARYGGERVDWPDSLRDASQRQFRDAADNAAIYEAYESLREGVPVEQVRARLAERTPGRPLQFFDEQYAHVTLQREAGLSGSARWATYSLDPSNPTYRETVIHLPGGGGRDLAEVQKAFNEGRATREQLAEANRQFENAFRQGHFDEPNVIAHARTSLQRDAAGHSVFLIDELQSDWGQKLREGGARDEAKIAELKKREDETRKAYLQESAAVVAELDKLNPEAALGMKPWEESPSAKLRLGREGIHRLREAFSADEIASARIDRIQTQWRELNRRGDSARIGSGLGVIEKVDELYERVNAAYQPLRLAQAELRTLEAATPGHPLVNTTDQWTQTAFRRLIRQAVEAGADRIAISPGKVQNDRFNVAKHVDRISYNTGTGVLSGVKDGRQVMTAMVDREKVPDYIGKELSEKLFATKAGDDGVHALDGLNGLEIGGHGMRATYDGIYPRALGKILSKLDPSIKQEEMGLQSSLDGRTFRPDLERDLDDDTIRLLRANRNDYDATIAQARRIATTGGTDLVRSAHERMAAALEQAKAKPPIQFHTFPLSDKIKQKVLDEGQAMFAIRGGRRRREELWHPLEKDGSRILAEPVRVEGYDEKDGQRYARFKHPDTGATAWWPADQMQQSGVREAADRAEARSRAARVDNALSIAANRLGALGAVTPGQKAARTKKGATENTQRQRILSLANEGGMALFDKYADGLRELATQHEEEVNKYAFPDAEDPIASGMHYFFGDFVSRPEDAKARAPDLFDAFRDFLDQHDPNLLQALEPIQQASEQYRQARLARLQSSIGIGPMPPPPIPGAAQPQPAPAGGGAQPPPIPPAGGAAGPPPVPPGGGRPPIPGVPPAPRATRAQQRTGLKKFLDAYKRTFQPELFSEKAMWADALTAEYASARQNEKDVILDKSEQFYQQFRNLSAIENIDYIKRVELGQRQPTNWLEDQAYRHRRMLDYTDRMEKLYGSKAQYVEDYFPHLWKDPDGAKNFFQTLGASQMGPTWFQKARFYDLVEQGLQNGLELKSTNPEELVVMRLLSGVDMRQRMEWLQQVERIGLAMPAANNPNTAGLARLEWATINAPNREQWLIAPDVQALWKNGVEAKGLWTNQSWVGSTFRGMMWLKNTWVPIKLALSGFHPLHVVHINQSASFARAYTQLAEGHDLIGALKSGFNAWNPITGAIGGGVGFAAAGPAGVPIGTWAGGMLGGAKTSYALVPYLTLGMVSRESPYRAAWLKSENQRTPEEQAQVKLFTEGGFVPAISEELKAHAKRVVEKAWDESKYLRLLPQGFRRAIEIFQAPIFENWIPHLKAHAYLMDAAALFNRRPDLLDDEIQRKVALRAIAKSNDNRFGQMFYGSLFWNRILKDANIAAFLSLGWNLGFAREFGGGLVVNPLTRNPISRQLISRTATQDTIEAATNKTAFSLIYLTTAAMTMGMISYANTGEQPEGWDFINPRLGGLNPDGSPRRIAQMSYLREVPMWIKHYQNQGGGISGALWGTAEMIKNKMVLQPAIDLLNNRDYWGYQIFSETGDLFSQAYRFTKQLFSGEFGKARNTAGKAGGDIAKRAGEAGSYIGEQMSPITIAGADRAAELSGKPYTPWGLDMTQWPSRFAERAQSLLPEKYGGTRGVGASMLGFGPAPSYVERSATDNYINRLYDMYVRPLAKPAEQREIDAERRRIRTQMQLANRGQTAAPVESRDSTGRAVRAYSSPFAEFQFKKLPEQAQRAVLERLEPGTPEYDKYMRLSNWRVRQQMQNSERGAASGREIELVAPH